MSVVRALSISTVKPVLDIESASSAFTDALGRSRLSSPQAPAANSSDTRCCDGTTALQRPRVLPLQLPVRPPPQMLPSAPLCVVMFPVVRHVRKLLNLRSSLHRQRPPTPPAASENSSRGGTSGGGNWRGLASGNSSSHVSGTISNTSSGSSGNSRHGARNGDASVCSLAAA
jgi:hypothetical protein